MNRLKEAAKIFALTMGGFLCLTASLVLWHLDASLTSFDAQMRNLTGQIGQLTIQAQDTLTRLGSNSDAALRDTRINLVRSYKVQRALQDFVEQTNANTNGPGGVLPELATAIRTNSADVTTLAQSVQPGAENFNRSMLTLRETLDEVRPQVTAAAMSTKQTGENIEGATKDLKQIADETSAFLHQQYNPAKQTMAHKILLIILNSIFGNAVQGAVRR